MKYDFSLKQRILMAYESGEGTYVNTLTQLVDLIYATIKALPFIYFEFK
ncbi:hypothetical protein EHE19_002795 [Ruminiclostridium herbifermentans]|uniref:Uncharacterized protein n=1 Tax=Ruminiclostridium herbifermentans TaxID=2488810 RepID=A0A7H1VQ10_9FIRM|nr:hypothetical protein [Ruminiclostridium herbifermentans]QNU67472.1 hypothetical protein EHE19_002795 [Ruminiclostridium herbifermentans]